MIVLDASVVIAHLSNTDAHHDAADVVLRQATRESLLMHSLTLAEVLVGGVRLRRGSQLRDDIRALGIAVAEPSADEPLRIAELRVSTALKLPDCCVLSVALAYRADLATFDGALAAAARQRGVVVLPS